MVVHWAIWPESKEENKMKKKFLIPEAILVEFADEDIIVTSAGAQDEYGDTGTEWWGNE